MATVADKKKTIIEARICALGGIELHNYDGPPDEVVGVLLQMEPEHVRRIAEAAVMYKSLRVTIEPLNESKDDEG